MNIQWKDKIEDIQCDLVMLEGMMEILVNSAYSGADSALIGNSLEIMKEFLSVRTNKLENIIFENII